MKYALVLPAIIGASVLALPINQGPSSVSCANSQISPTPASYAQQPSTTSVAAESFLSDDQSSAEELSSSQEYADAGAAFKAEQEYIERAITLCVEYCKQKGTGCQPTAEGLACANGEICPSSSMLENLGNVSFGGNDGASGAGGNDAANSTDATEYSTNESAKVTDLTSDLEASYFNENDNLNVKSPLDGEDGGNGGANGQKGKDGCAGSSAPAPESQTVNVVKATTTTVDCTKTPTVKSPLDGEDGENGGENGQNGKDGRAGNSAPAQETPTVYIATETTGTVDHTNTPSVKSPLDGEDGGNGGENGQNGKDGRAGSSAPAQETPTVYIAETTATENSNTPSVKSPLDGEDGSNGGENGEKGADGHAGASAPNAVKKRQETYGGDTSGDGGMGGTTIDISSGDMSGGGGLQNSADMSSDTNTIDLSNIGGGQTAGSSTDLSSLGGGQTSDSTDYGSLANGQGTNSGGTIQISNGESLNSYDQNNQQQADQQLGGQVIAELTISQGDGQPGQTQTQTSQQQGNGEYDQVIQQLTGQSTQQQTPGQYTQTSKQVPGQTIQQNQSGGSNTQTTSQSNQQLPGQQYGQQKQTTTPGYSQQNGQTTTPGYTQSSQSQQQPSSYGSKPSTSSPSLSGSSSGGGGTQVTSGDGITPGWDAPCSKPKGSVAGANGGNYVPTSEWKDIMVSAHNALRAEHGTGPLRWSDEIAKAAESHITSCQYTGQHTSQSQLASMNLEENMGMHPMFDPVLYAYDMWGVGEESGVVDWNNPSWSEKTGHVTQMIWEATTEVGCAIRICDGQVTQPGEPAYFFLCNYRCAGNDMNGFKQNVKPRKDGKSCGTKKRDAKYSNPGGWTETSGGSGTGNQISTSPIQYGGNQMTPTQYGGNSNQMSDMMSSLMNSYKK